MTQKHTLIPDQLGLGPGNLVITDYNTELWGSVVRVNCIYRYPPDVKPFTLVFRNVRNMDVYVQKGPDRLREIEEAQLLTHDLGEPKYERTCRLASTAVELIISYDTVDIEKDW